MRRSLRFTALACWRSGLNLGVPFFLRSLSVLRLSRYRMRLIPVVFEPMGRPFPVLLLKPLSSRGLRLTESREISQILPPFCDLSEVEKMVRWHRCPYWNHVETK
jgi:hypothetical protein